jgi:hypothetical protein
MPQHQSMGRGWENIRRYGTDGRRALPEGQPAYTAAQLETIRLLNVQLTESDVPFLKKWINNCAKILYFRNLNVPNEDISILLNELPSARLVTQFLQRLSTISFAKYKERFGVVQHFSTGLSRNSKTHPLLSMVLWTILRNETIGGLRLPSIW